MGAGCSSTPKVYDHHTRVKPPSQSSVRLLNAFGELTKAPSKDYPAHTINPENNDTPSHLESTPSSCGLSDNNATPNDEQPLLLTPGVDIQPQADKPLLKQRQTIPPFSLDASSPRSQVSASDINAPLLSTTSFAKLMQHSSSNGSQNNDDNDCNNEDNNNEDETGESEMPRSNSDETPSKPALSPPPENSRRRNSISVLPSFQPKPKVPGNVGADGKKTDPDLVLWISNKLKTKLKLARISKAYDRFIPSNFYSEMGKQDIREVDLGECVIVRKSILFCDIRNFTAFSSKIGPQDTFKFINAFSRRLLPVVRKHGGYIDKFIGDALVALFPTPAHSIFAGYEILLVLEDYNHERIAKSLSSIRVGIGCHTGTLMLGTVGDAQRMDGIAIGNVISLASQVEMATKLFGVDFIATQAIVSELKEEEKLPFLFRRIGRIKEGTDDDQLINIYQVATKQSQVAEIKERFEEGVDLFQQKNFSKSAEVFLDCLTKLPQDKPSLVLENRAQHFLACTYLPADWGNGLTYHTEFMTQSTLPTLQNSPSQPHGFQNMAGNNHNLVLMRLVFSAIFHMQKKNTDESDGEDEEPGETMVEVPSRGRVTLPPIASSNSVSANLGSEMRGEKEKKPLTEEKEKDLITLVLSGFENHNRVSYLTKAYQRFVPNDFLSYLGKDSVQQVDIGDSMMTTITTMFIEIHGFQPKSRLISDKTLNQLQGLKRFSDPPSASATHLQPNPVPLQPSPSGRRLGRMASKNTADMRADLFSFQFLNTISQKLLPIIRQCDGYVDKFFGNAILALFPSLDAATSAGLQIMAAVKSFDVAEEHEDSVPPYAQIGMNSGNVILGTVGDGKRMDGTVIGNTVNVAARMLSLNKIYNTKFVTTARCIAQLGQQSLQTSPSLSSQPSYPSPPPTSASSPSVNSSTLPPLGAKKDPGPPPKAPGAYKFYNQRMLDTVKVPGKSESIAIHEIFDNESQVALIKSSYEAGLLDYQAKKFDTAKKHCEDALQLYPGDVPTQMLLEKCNQCIRDGVSSDWDGVTVVAVK